MTNRPSKRGKFYRIYRIVSLTAAAIGVAYLLLLNFPQPLFAYSTEYGSFKVYSREPIKSELTTVLDSAESRLKTSPLYDDSFRRNVYLTASHAMYALLSHKAYKSFANSLPFVDNIMINRSDVAADRVFVNRPLNNSRSLSGVVAHEVTHLLIRRRYGTITAALMPRWKNEGYCEYVAGDSTITSEEGLARWRDNPSDDSSYNYIKYHLMVKYLLENEKVSVDDLFKKSFDENQVAEKTFAAFGKLS